MVFRLGYVAMTLSLENCSPSGTVTYASYKKLNDEKAQRSRLLRVSRCNIENTLRILKYNYAMNISVYRLTSKLIPLSTHSELREWNYSKEFRDEFIELGNYIKSRNFRISAHPDHFTILNSNRPEVIEASINDLHYHVNLFEAMGLCDYKYKLVLHVGGRYDNKEEAADRFKQNFIKLPDRIRKRIILENDDKIFTAAEVLAICRELGIPMVLDVHHHKCANNGELISELLPGIFNTWSKEPDSPKIHFSSPKNEKEFRSHSDYIDYSDFMKFINSAKVYDKNIDIMLEAKMKDKALLALSGQLAETEELTMINRAAFQI